MHSNRQILSQQWQSQPRTTNTLLQSQISALWNTISCIREDMLKHRDGRLQKGAVRNETDTVDQDGR